MHLLVHRGVALEAKQMRYGQSYLIAIYTSARCLENCDAAGHWTDISDFIEGLEDHDIFFCLKSTLTFNALTGRRLTLHILRLLVLWRRLNSFSWQFQFIIR